MSRSSDPNRHIHYIFTGLKEATPTAPLITPLPDIISSSSDENTARHYHIDSLLGPLERECNRILSKYRQPKLDNKSLSIPGSKFKKNPEAIIPSFNSILSGESSNQTQSKLLK